VSAHQQLRRGAVSAPDACNEFRVRSTIIGDQPFGRLRQDSTLRARFPSLKRI
jgi:hypothetical protein